ncbi:pyruvate dehydrogenase [Phaeobacter gallaeciensis]|uniref:biotin/lipoyl-containing protein n=1 Tax=Phaeobacter gallaeciensis TaxID=60890 RepID=UPI0023804D14|nr:biotin/lipoyl-containing protein [Phaeobacter gallaeciensis]MDE4275912.1 pyruvate dehydrogenase [Phaeobacter gallaeciensis]MDE4301140.1 pyruvate dehydrogenase [Phaeobacter gallaeciensis]MDE5187166.1 pyruvate dehydrogenase [Phaeobacter gallaeciensis]
MPALGMAQDTGLIVAWHKSEGDAVKTGDVLFEVETDKATMEVEAQADGFLNGLRARAGEEVPVGNVIAEIGAEAGVPEAASAAAPSPELPEGASVIMPALGMAQDSGRIVSWHKGLGEAVAASDILFEVETDKATMEVEAGTEGFVAALLAEAGEEAPLGAPIAIISPEAPSNPVQLSQSSAASAARAEVAPANEPAVKPAEVAKPAPKAPAAPRTDGRILASPKARRLGLEQGLDLSRLVDAGHPQPFHVADLEFLKSLPATAPQGMTAQSRRLTAELAQDGFADFEGWAAETAGLDDANALLAGLAASSLKGGDAIVAVEAAGRSLRYAIAGGLGDVAHAETDVLPDILLRDLRMSRVTTVDLGAEACPVLTLTRSGPGLLITLECAADHLTASESVSLLSEFAGRVEQPLRHLL